MKQGNGDGMTKVGIITWHYHENYGSALQAFAMQRIIEKLGYDVEIINYRANAKTGLIYSILRFFKNHLYYLPNSLLGRAKAFYQFRKRFFTESSMYTSNEELIEEANHYDIYICGSDQIWAPNRFDLPYLLNFVSDDKKKIAYAPSVVIDNFTEEQKNMLKKELLRFDYLSLREPYGVDIIKKIIDMEVIDVLDPTLLLNRKDYEPIIRNVGVKNPYILCYLIGDKREHRDMVMKIKEQYGYDIITLPFKAFDQNFGDIQIRDAGPSEFLGLLKGASIICTDSFHGILFSIIFEKQFYAFKRFDDNDILNQNARVINIINKLGLSARIVDKVEDINQEKAIDYSGVMNKLEKEKKKSLTFLVDALNGEKVV